MFLIIFVFVVSFRAHFFATGADSSSDDNKDTNSERAGQEKARKALVSRSDRDAHVRLEGWRRSHLVARTYEATGERGVT